MFKRSWILLLTIGAGLALGGCVQMHSTTVIDKDGSGTASFQLSLSQGVGEALKQMQEMNLDTGQDMDIPDFDEIDKAKIEAAAKDHGVKITKFSRDPINGREALTVEMTFADLKGFSYVMNKVMGEGPDKGGFGLFDAGDGNFVLKSTTYDFPEEVEAEAEDEVEEMEAPEMDPAQMSKQMELMGKLMATMSELDIRMEITVPGDIIASNAPEVQGRTSIWVVNSGNMMSQQGDMEPEITFSGKGLKLKASK